MPFIILSSGRAKSTQPHSRGANYYGYMEQGYLINDKVVSFKTESVNQEDYFDLHMRNLSADTAKMSVLRSAAETRDLEQGTYIVCNRWSPTFKKILPLITIEITNVVEGLTTLVIEKANNYVDSQDNYILSADPIVNINDKLHVKYAVARSMESILENMSKGYEDNEKIVKSVFHSNVTFCDYIKRTLEHMQKNIGFWSRKTGGVSESLYEGIDLTKKLCDIDNVQTDITSFVSSFILLLSNDISDNVRDLITDVSARGWLLHNGNSPKDSDGCWIIGAIGTETKGFVPSSNKTIKQECSFLGVEDKKPHFNIMSFIRRTDEYFEDSHDIIDTLIADARDIYQGLDNETMA